MNVVSAKCRHAERERVRVIKANGSIQAFDLCCSCGILFAGIKLASVDVESIRLYRDDRTTVPPCVVCGVRGTENHHWAPRALFGEEADLWPTAWLCPGCHSRWHKLTRTG